MSEEIPAEAQPDKVHFSGYIQKITRIYGQQERNRD